MALRKQQYKSVMWKELYSSGIVKVKDLISEEGQFIDLNQYCTSHHIKFNFIQTLILEKTIPASWIAEITSKAKSGRRVM